MNTKIRRTAALCAAAVPAAGLALVAGFSQTLYAGGACFDPTLQLFTQVSPAAYSPKGDATAALKVKPPFILEGVSSATGYLDCDSGISAANAMGTVSRFFTPTCSGWSYGWCARGSVVGEIKSKASKTGQGSAIASCSFSATAAGDLSPPAHSTKVASSATQGGASATMNVSTNPPNVSYSIGQTNMAQTVSPSTNPGGDAKVLFDGPKVNVGAGAETIVVVNLAQEHNSSAMGGGVATDPHVRKSDSSTGGYAGAAITQDLFALGPYGVSLGISVHPQTGSYRGAKRSDGGAVYGPWRPPFGELFDECGPKIEWVDDAPLPPDEHERTDTGDGYHHED